MFRQTVKAMHEMNGIRYASGGADRDFVYTCSHAEFHSERLSQFSEWCTRASKAGLIAFQEVVSMVPPLLLDIQPHHFVADLCAAPGFEPLNLLSQPPIDPTGLPLSHTNSLSLS